jgi:RimJ/RimL family protein N-acetyltransferase
LKHVVLTQPEVNFAIDLAGEAVGGVGFCSGTDVERHSAEVGYWLGESVWGRG